MDKKRYQLNDPYWSRGVVLVWALPILTILSIIRLTSGKKKRPPSMDTTRTVHSSSSSSSSSSFSSSSSSAPSWGVFLSFYGKDTRKNFISHLYSALDQAGISTFRDDPALEKGEEISSGLRDAIKKSNKFVVVISENYARSSWCLNELVEILGCKQTKNQVVPVFYYVDPTDLRYQKKTIGKALGDHKRRYSVDMIEKWKSALAQIAELSGCHLKENADENESDTIQNIVENLARQACTKELYLDEYLLGIDSAVEDIYQKLNMESNDVCALGICGMGGIGKTTIAKAFYNKYSDRFDRSCFIENIKQYSKVDGPLSPFPFLEQLLNELLRKKDYKVYNVASGISKLKHILSSEKVLIVLDDLDQSGFSNFLAPLCNLFSAGSKIIITTRDANLPDKLNLKKSEVDIYYVKELESTDSLVLFSYHAFGRPAQPEYFKELSGSFVTYAGGLPLALKVLGSYLHGKTQVSVWKDKLEKVQKIPEEKILQILKLSYDELDATQMAIFLDIVFFFIGKDKDEAIHIFKSCKFYPDEGIPVLLERCLLTVDSNNKFQMHNLIQDMGWKVIRDESKLLYLSTENACDVLQHLEGTSKIGRSYLRLENVFKKTNECHYIMEVILREI